ncbi:MAG: hypothetical protein EHM90_00445 [Chloroflexi bacterium]|nr:MAG: hypothetical protein EHM90_00445 [Chloroflexota bacterium]
MSLVSFTDYVPSARYDGNPWTLARIEEATSSAGPWTVADTITLDPEDGDPANPRARSFTTDAANDLSTWFRIVWVDAAANGEATDPVARNIDSFRARVMRLTAYDYEPMLTPDDIDDLVTLAQRADENGRDPDEDDWEPTYDLTAAVASGWETKAARASGDFRFEEDNQAFYREHVYQHCRKQADRWGRGMVAVPVVGYQGPV